MVSLIKVKSVESQVVGDRTRIGLIMYSDDAKVEFHLNKYTTLQDILVHIK